MPRRIHCEINKQAEITFRVMFVQSIWSYVPPFCLFKVLGKKREHIMLYHMHYYYFIFKKSEGKDVYFSVVEQLPAYPKPHLPSPALKWTIMQRASDLTQLAPRMSWVPAPDKSWPWWYAHVMRALWRWALEGPRTWNAGSVKVGIRGSEVPHLCSDYQARHCTVIAMTQLQEL